MFKKIYPVIFILALVLSSCAAAQRQSESNGDNRSFQSSGDMAAPAAPMEAPAKAADEYSGGTGSNIPSGESMQGAERLVIRNANLSIVVEDPAQSMEAIARMAAGMNGFVVSSNLYKTGSEEAVQYQQGQITVRVPSEQLDAALAQIKGLTKDPKKDVQNESVSGQDVTKEYTDLNSRLKNLQDTEAQLREIMGSATKTEDVLAVYNQISQIREQIEVIQGQIQYYKESAALSAITVQLIPAASIQPIEIGGWQPVGVARDALQALVNAMQFLASAAIWLVIVVLPVGLLIFLPLRLLWWLIRRGTKKPKVQAPPAPPAAV